MTQLDDEIKAEIAALTDELPLIATVTRPGVGDPSTGTAASSTTLGTARMSPPFGVEERFLGTDLVRQSDIQAIIENADLAFAPRQGDYVSWTLPSAKSARVVLVEPYQSGARIAAWAVILRGSE